MENILAGFVIASKSRVSFFNGAELQTHVSTKRRELENMLHQERREKM